MHRTSFSAQVATSIVMRFWYESITTKNPYISLSHMTEINNKRTHFINDEFLIKYTLILKQIKISIKGIFI